MNDLEKKKIELSIIKQIKDVAKELAISPLDLGYNTWLMSVDKTWADSYKSLGVTFKTLKEAHFSTPPDLVSTFKPLLQVQAKENRDKEKKLVQDSIFWNHFEEVSTKIFKNKIQPTGFSLSKRNHIIERELNLLLSDLHFGASLNPNICPLPYGSNEEARRLAAVVKEVCEFKVQYRDHTNLNVFLLGDIIQGQLHDKRDGKIQAEQEAAAMYLLSQAITVLAAHFPNVTVRCVTGNHDRNTARHVERVTFDKHDSRASVIYFAIKLATASLPNVKVEIGEKPYIEYNSFGKIGFGTHGDTVLNAGNVGQSINVRSLEQQCNRISAGLRSQEKPSLFFIGHVHTASLVHLPNYIFISNGALIPTDQYGISIGSFSLRNGQWCWESCKGYIVGDSRFIVVDEYIDKDKALEKIIKPFSKF